MTTPSTEVDTGRRLAALESALYNLQRERSGYTSTLDNCPVGAIVGYLTDILPPGWIHLDGSVVTASEYPQLYAYLVSNGRSTTLPDWTDRVPIGAGNLYTGTSTGGSKDAIVVSHTHHTGHASTAAEATGHGAPVSVSFENRVRVNRAGGVGTGDVSDSTGSSGTNANLPPYAGCFWMIRT